VKTGGSFKLSGERKKVGEGKEKKRGKKNKDTSYFLFMKNMEKLWGGVAGMRAKTRLSQMRQEKRVW